MGLVNYIRETYRESDWAFKIKVAFAATGFAFAGAMFIRAFRNEGPVNPPIIHLVSINDIEAAREAVEKHSSALRAVDLDGNTPLHIAARGGYVGMVEALIAAGADVNLPNRDGWTPLASALLAARAEQLPVVEALLAAGAKTDVLLGDGETLTSLARTMGGVDPKVVPLIVPRDSAVATAG